MNSKDTIKEIIKLRGYSYGAIAKKLGYISKSGVVLSTGVRNRLFGAQEMRVDTLIRFLEALDCKLVIESNATDSLRWVINLDKKES